MQTGTDSRYKLALGTIELIYSSFRILMSTKISWTVLYGVIAVWIQLSFGCDDVPQIPFPRENATEFQVQVECVIKMEKRDREYL